MPANKDQSVIESTATHTRELGFFDDEECLLNAPEVVVVAFSDADVARWIYLSELIIREQINTIRLFDGRCAFFDEEYDPKVEKVTPSDFQQEAASLVITAHTVCWEGYTKNGSSRSHWSSDHIGLDELKALKDQA